MQIIAMGGGGFSMEPENPLLDQYILAQVPKEKPKVCFIPTASGDAQGYVERFYEAFKHHPCEATHLSLFRPNFSNLEEYVLDQDILYVGGGNTYNLLVLWREWGLDQIIRKAWTQGLILAGLSAGAICWFEEGNTDSFSGELARLSALGLLEGSFCPHYDGEENRRSSFQRMIQTRELKDGIACDDGAAVHFVGTEFKQAISSRQQAKAYTVKLDTDIVVETPLPTVYLGG